MLYMRERKVVLEKAFVDVAIINVIARVSEH